MATYYRWAKSNFQYAENGETATQFTEDYVQTFFWSSKKPAIVNGEFDFTNPTSALTPQYFESADYCTISTKKNVMYSPFTAWNYRNGVWIITGFNAGAVTKYTIIQKKTTFIEYVYSVSPSTYPNGGVQGNYYYDQRTTITSPTAPTGLTYPNPITTPKVTVSWDAATSNVPSYLIHQYELSYSADGGKTWPWTSMSAQTSTTILVPAGATTLQVRIRAQDTNGAWSDYTTGENVTILLAPTITVPSLAMQGQPISVNWTSITGATSYTLQRKANTDDDWVRVNSGGVLTFTETAGAWSSVQYRIQAVFDGTPGGWSQPVNIPVVSASALVISGQDGDLGTLAADVPYTVSSDTGNPITLTRTVNSVQVASLTVESGFAYSIPVMDLPTGTGTIVISATVQATSGPVTATRTWTYTKTAFSFPNTGGTAQLQQGGKNVFPATLAECVRVGANLGGNLGLALQALANSAQYDPETGGFTDPAGNTIPVPKIETGSYVGTGTYGKINPNRLSFNFAPKIVIITVSDEVYGNWYATGIFSNMPQANDFTSVSDYGYFLSYAGSIGKLSDNHCYINENTLFWYQAAAPARQLNERSKTYHYVAIG